MPHMVQKIPKSVRDKLKNLPDKPGCYLMRNGDGKVIYVGKAIVLKNRVRSYFHASANHHPKTKALVAEIQDITWWVTETELEALVLENELIKRYWPHYNIRLKDDRQFPYIKINWQEDFPRIEVVRRRLKDKARYFGPYTSATNCYRTLDALRRIFPYLDCDRTITGNDARPCLYYHIKMCGGPCIGKQSREEYRATIQQLMDFLQGNTDQVLSQMETQMNRAAENLQFELAAIYRDRLKAAQGLVEQQQIIEATMVDADCIAVSVDPRSADAAVQIYMVRNGRLTGRENFMLEGADIPETDVNLQGELIGSFIQQYYEEATFLPKLIMVQALPPDGAVLEEWLATKRATKVELRVPQRGAKAKLMTMAANNADEYLRVQKAERAADTNRQTEALAELQEALQLEQPPARIECFDISTLQGTNTVGSMVVFAKGTPLKNAYKRFKIRDKGAQGSPDDFGSMREMLRRRFRRAVEERTDTDPGKKARKSNESWRILPDLIIIDGGKGQLGVAVEVLEEFDLLDKIPVVGLAKREEEIFRPGRSQPVWLTRGSQSLHLVQRIRDEAHRFAITYHRNLRRKEQTRSKLDDVRGIGPKRRKALLTYYNGNIDKVREATIEELCTIPGMNRRSAEAIKEQL
jgi:excinuclease ABC subunit C